MSNLDISKITAGLLSQQLSETKIKEYKVFYKTHFQNVRNRHSLLTQLSDLCVRFQQSMPVTPLLTDPERTKLKTLAEKILKDNFSEDVLKLYNKQIPVPEPKKKYSNLEESFWLSLLVGLSQTFETVNEQNKQEWAYKTNFLSFLYNCLFHYGLHPDILRRNPDVFKRYNFKLEHNFKSARVRQIETKILLKAEVLQSEFISPYEKKLPIRISGKLIPFKSIYSIKITSTFLQDDEIELFAAKNKLRWSSTSKDETSFIDQCFDETETLHKNPYLIEDAKEKFRNQNTYFVDPSRIVELKKIKSKDFDLIKLVQLCDELNNASTNGSVIGPTLLVRAIIDHLPPVFGFKNFSEVANNYTSGTQSFKKGMMNLNNSLRTIADNNIHSHARKKEVLPTKTQIDFSQELDLLLSEVVRVLK